MLFYMFFFDARDIGNEVTYHQAEGNRHFFLELTDVAELEPTQRPKHLTALPKQRHGSQVNRESSPVTTVPSTKHINTMF